MPGQCHGPSPLCRPLNLYETLKGLHVGLAMISVTGFVVRWIAAEQGAGWMQARWVRIVPHLVDTLLLLSGAAMAVHWGSASWQGWLGVKILALIAYILCGSVALKNSRPAGVRRLAFAAALLAVGWIVSIALSKSAWGPFTLLT